MANNQILVAYATWAGATHEDYEKLSWPMRMMVKMIGSTQKEDLRGWDAIREWATELHPKLLGET